MTAAVTSNDSTATQDAAGFDFAAYLEQARLQVARSVPSPMVK